VLEKRGIIEAGITPEIEEEHCVKQSAAASSLDNDLRKKLAENISGKITRIESDQENNK
jgi:hypothetical protein